MFYLLMFALLLMNSVILYFNHLNGDAPIGVFWFTLIGIGFV